MATPTPYDGGRGGKIRRPTRRHVAPSTPYDRPSTAARALRAENAESGWISKITRPATWLFGSVFGSRRPVEEIEPEDRGGNDPLVQEDEEVAINKPSHEPQQEGKNIDKSFATVDTDTSNISEFEQLLKQKTLTRNEFEHLVEVLRSRTIDLDSKPSANNEILDASHISPCANVAEQPASTGDFSMQLHDPTILSNEAASPEELAKAYMSSRVKVSPSLGMQGQVSLEKKTKPIYTPDPVMPSFFSKSVVRISGSAENPESGYLTPKSSGKSALHKFSRTHDSTIGKDGEIFTGEYTGTSYFQTPNSTFSSSMRRDGKIFKGEYPGSNSYFETPKNTISSSARQDGKIFKGEYPGSTSYFETPKSTISSSARQVLKRRSSVLDSDPASFGPMRRLRQKHLVSPLTKVSVGNLPHGSSSKVMQDVNGYSTTLISDQLLGLHEKTQEQTVGKGENKVYCNSAAAVPPKSAATAKKIFQHLDKLSSSPKEKLPKLLVSDGSYLKNKDVHENNLAVDGHSPVIGIRKILYEKQATTKENGFPTLTALGIKLSSESSGKNIGVLPAIDALPGTNSAAPSSDFIFSHQKKPAFQISRANKDSPVMKKDDCITKDSFNPMDASKKEAEAEIADEKAVCSETTRTHSHSCTSGSLKLTNSLTNDSADIVSETGAGFKFPTTPAPNTYSLTHIHATSSKVDDSSLMMGQNKSPSFSFGGKSTNYLVFSSPTIATSVDIPAAAENGVMQKEQTAAPLFSFGAKDSHRIVFLPPTTNGGSGFIPSSENGPSSQLRILSTLGQKELDNGLQGQTPYFMSSSSSKATTAPSLSAFGASNDGRPKNDSLGVSSTDSTGTFCSSQTSVSQSSSNILSSTIAPISSKGLLFQSGPTKGLEEKNTKASPFSLDGSMPASSIFKTENNALSGLAKTPKFSNVSPVPTASGFATSSFSSTIVGSQSTQSASTVTSAGINISAESSNSSSLVVDSSLKESGSLLHSTTQSELKIPSNLDKPGAVFSSSASPFSFSAGAVSSSTEFSTSVDSNPFKSSTKSFSFGSGASLIQNSFTMSSTSVSSSSSPFMSGFSTASPFSFTSASASVLSSPFQPPVFGAAAGQMSASPGNEEISHKISSDIPTDLSGTPSIMASMPAITASQTGATPPFQFGSQQNSPALDTGTSEFPVGGSFSMGSGGIDKSKRRIIKAKRKK